MAIQIMSLVIVGLIVVYFLRKEKAKDDRYFGKQRKYNKKELAILDRYKSIYKPILNDKRFPNIKNRAPVTNITFSIGEVSCFADSFVVTGSAVLRINICGENHNLRQAPNR